MSGSPKRIWAQADGASADIQYQPMQLVHGTKRPSGLPLVLLSVIRRKGLNAIL